MEQDTMIPIPIAEFIMGNRIPVDIFVRLNDQKFVMIAKADSQTDRKQLTTYNNKEVHYLWVRKKDYARLLQQTIAIAGIVSTKNDIDFKRKTNVLSAAASGVFRQLEEIGISIQAFNHAKMVAEATMAMAEVHKDLAALLESLSSTSDRVLGHSMAVSYLSVLIATTMGWEKKLTLEKLALGGLLHDIGKKTLPKDLLEKPIARMTTDEVALWETHPYRGAQLLLSLGIVPDDLVSVVYEHHENSLGMGYPQRLRDLKIHPLAKVVALANEFVNLTVANPNCPVPKNPREALMYIEFTMGQPFNREAFKALKIILENEESTLKVA